MEPLYCLYFDTRYIFYIISISRGLWVKVVKWDYCDVIQSFGDFQNKLSRVTTILFSVFSILVGQSYFNAINNIKHTIKCILQGLGGVEISSATRTLVIICKVYFIAVLNLFTQDFQVVWIRGSTRPISLFYSKVDRVIIYNIYD